VAHALRARGVLLPAATSEAVLRGLRPGMADRSSDDRLAALQTVAVLILNDLGVDRKEWTMDNGQLRMKRTPLCRGYFCILHSAFFPAPRPGGQRHPPAAGNVLTFQRSNVLTF